MTKRSRKNKHLATVVMFLVLLAIAGVIGFLVWKNYFADRKVEPELDNDNVAAIKKEEDSVLKEDKKEEKKEEIPTSETEIETEKKTPQYEGSDPNYGQSLTGAITYAAVNDGVFVVRVNIDQYIEDGTCKLSLVKDGAVVYSEDAAIVGLAMTSTCEGFDINMADGLGGDVNVKIQMSAGDKAGMIEKAVSL